jgi:hypothetical protein
MSSAARPFLLTALLLTVASAQEPPQSFRTDTSGVVVDVVVKDRSGNPVTDLTMGDFELLEDGVTQTAESMTLVAPPVTRATGTARSAPADESASDPRRRAARFQPPRSPRQRSSPWFSIASPPKRGVWHGGAR